MVHMMPLRACLDALQGGRFRSTCTLGLLARLRLRGFLCAVRVVIVGVAIGGRNAIHDIFIGIVLIIIVVVSVGGTLALGCLSRCGGLRAEALGCSGNASRPATRRGLRVACRGRAVCLHVAVEDRQFRVAIDSRAARDGERGQQCK